MQSCKSARQDHRSCAAGPVVAAEKSSAPPALMVEAEKSSAPPAGYCATARNRVTGVRTAINAAVLTGIMTSSFTNLAVTTGRKPFP